MPGLTLRGLRAHAVARSLRTSATLLEAIDAQGFVQLDPIRAPARAADLILRHRVADYRVGDLDRAYPVLPLAEDYVHVYGVIPRATLQWLHPRSARHRRHVEHEHPRLAARILAHVAAHGETHPRDLAVLGRTRTVNGWGGESAATTRMLEVLHHRGKLSVARRANGIKVYALAPPVGSPVAANERARAILSLLLDLYAPLPEPTLRQLVRMVPETSLSPALLARALDQFRHGPDVRRVAIDGMDWLLPAGEEIHDDVPTQVRLLAPFDPVVWDRRRFAAFWGWDYRLEAYTPPAKRKLGYYALPLLWRDDIVGWANAAMKDGTLAADIGLAKTPPRAAGFRRELDAELERLRTFVGAARAVVNVGAQR
jgi:uncharacterized protein YcaQ